jgi:hypothetical protein
MRSLARQIRGCLQGLAYPHEDALVSSRLGALLHAVERLSSEVGTLSARLDDSANVLQQLQAGLALVESQQAQLGASSNSQDTRVERRLEQLTGGLEQMGSGVASLRQDITRGLASGYVDKGTQILLRLSYRQLAEHRSLLPLREVEFRNYSENGEDGILWYVFSVVGDPTKVCVDIGAGTGVSGNCANLLLNHGWTGLLIDGNAAHVEKGRAYFANDPSTRLFPPRFLHAWVTAENINELIRSNGVSGEVDLLSLDIDGVDYWVWKALDAISPRVVIAEVQAIWLSDAAVTVPYDPGFSPRYIDGLGVYSGASLPAFVKLGKEKGYRLVGCQRYGFNAIFVRNDVGCELLPESRSEDCFGHPFSSWAHEVLLPQVKDLPWEPV